VRPLVSKAHQRTDRQRAKRLPPTQVSQMYVNLFLTVLLSSNRYKTRLTKVMQMTETEAAWLAGILEGEGCFDWNRSAEGKRWPRIRIAMCDEDVIHRVKEVTGGRTAVSCEKRTLKPNWRPSYRFQIAHREKVREVLVAIRPWMGERRAETIDEMLAVLDSA